MSVPPAMYSTGASLRPAWARNARAAARSRGRSRVKGCMAQPPCAGPVARSRILDRRDDVVVGAAAAEIAAHPVADLLRRAGMALVDAGDAGHDLPGRAIAALERIALDEGGLQRVELVALGQAFDRRDLAAFHQGGERQAGLHALAVHQHRAGAALAEAAALLRAGQMQVLAQGVEQRGARIERQPMLGSVDAQHDVERSGRCAVALRRGRRNGSRHELSSYKSAAGHCSDFQQLSSGRDQCRSSIGLFVDLGAGEVGHQVKARHSAHARPVSACRSSWRIRTDRPDAPYDDDLMHAPAATRVGINR